jgi:DNA polymerase-1
MWQTICGDATDCYPGAYRVGPKSDYAEDIISADREDLWDIVLAAFASVGLTEEDAIHQARQAHILRHTDYDYQRKEPLLWSPLWLNT